MSQAVKETSTYTEGLARVLAESGEAPAWLKDLRERAAERFESEGFPTTDEEDWK